MGLFDINIDTHPATPPEETTDTDALYAEQYSAYMRSLKFEQLVNWAQLIAAIIGIIVGIMYILKRTK